MAPVPKNLSMPVFVQQSTQVNLDTCSQIVKPNICKISMNICINNKLNNQIYISDKFLYFQNILSYVNLIGFQDTFFMSVLSMHMLQLENVFRQSSCLRTRVILCYLVSLIAVPMVRVKILLSFILL